MALAQRQTKTEIDGDVSKRNRRRTKTEVDEDGDIRRRRPTHSGVDQSGSSLSADDRLRATKTEAEEEKRRRESSEVAFPFQ